MENADDKRVMTQPEKVEYILNGACDYFGIKKDDLPDKKGNRSLIWEKKKYMINLLWNYTVCSPKEIAKLLGYKNFQTVHYHYNKIKEELSGELYGAQKTQMIYNELLTYLNLTSYENKTEDRRD